MQEGAMAATNQNDGKEAAPASSHFAEARIGRSGLLVDAVEDVLPACRASYTESLIEVEVGNGGIHLAGRTAMGFQARRSLEAPHDGAGRVAVNADELARTLRSLRHEPVTLSVAPDGVTIIGSARITLPAADKSLPVPVVAGEAVGETRIQDFLEAIERVYPATSTDRAKQVLGCIAIGLRTRKDALVMATDSYRAAIVNVPWEGYEGPDDTLLLPRDIAAYVLRRYKRWKGSLRVHTKDGWAVFEFSDRWSKATATVAALVVYGEWPRLLELLPSEAEANYNVITVGDVRSLSELASAAADVAGKEPIWLGLGPEGVTMAATAELGAKVETTLPGASYEGEPTEIALDGRYLADLARFATGLPVLRLKVRGPLQPIAAGVLDADGFAYLLAPIRKQPGGAAS